MMIQSLVLEREQLALWQEPRTDGKRKENKRKENKRKDEGDAAEVRQKRKERVKSPPPGEVYTKIILHCTGNKKIGRQFRPNAFFQVHWSTYNYLYTWNATVLHILQLITVEIITICKFY